MEPFIGQISIFGGNFAPRGWAFCDGQLLPISQNQALFSILGTTYGGDGRTTFALPDLRGRFPMHPGHGPGLSSRRLGEKLGTETNTLTQNNLPAHNHVATVGGNVKQPVSTSSPDTASPVDAYAATHGGPAFAGNATAGSYMGALENNLNVTVNNSGGNQPVNNMQPTQCVSFIIALQGVFPSRS